MVSVCGIQSGFDLAQETNNRNFPVLSVH